VRIWRALVQLDRIVAGVDGSPNSVAALEWGVGLAELVGAELVAVHALGLLERLDDDTLVPANPHRDEIVRRFENVWCAPLARSQVTSRRVVRDGPPLMVLLAMAEEEHADAVLVGSRGLGGHPGLLLGSTSTQVAQHARCPVLIVPAAVARE
jgi:nucleotide-binding universal stress UspA family protein